jgi:Fe-S-cluster containining protein
MRDKKIKKEELTPDKNVDERVRERLKNIASELPKSVVEPQKLCHDDKISFKCYPGIKCFTACCRKVRINLTPYDIYRIKKRLNLSYEQFLRIYTATLSIDNSPLPIPALRHKDKETEECPFVTPDGCTIYEDRPVTCRYYPIGMAIMKQYTKNSGEDFYIKIKEEHCLGHYEKTVWTIDEWRADQKADLYDGMNTDWLEVVLKAKTLGMVEFSKKSLRFFHMASTDMDMFRRFVFESKLLEAYDFEKETIQRIKDDELELLKFAQKWLRFILFGEGDFKLKDGALEKRIKEKQEKMRKAAP